MESLFYELLQVLERQREILKEMLSTARDHNMALRENDLGAIKEAVARGERAAARLKVEDQRREQLQAAIEKELGLPEGTPLSRVLPRAPEQCREALSLLAGEMRDTASNIARLVDLNGILTRRAMLFNEQILRLLKPGDGSTYQPTGKTASPAGNAPSLLNRTV